MFYKVLIIYFIFDKVYSQIGLKAIKAIAGKKASIECLTDYWDENEIQLVLWYREHTGNGYVHDQGDNHSNEGTIPFYKLDSRHRQLFKAKHIVQNEAQEHRFEFDVTVTPPVLIINPVLVDDEGWYRCRVDYKAKRTQSFSSYLEVIGPPNNLKIMDTNGQELNELIGPFNEFDNIALVCEARDGNPSPALIWYHINILEVIIDNTYSTNRTGITRNELNLRQLDRNDYRTRLSCRASSDALYEPLQRSVIIDMNLKPLSVKILTQTTKPLIAGRLAEFRCAAQGSRPAAHIDWLIGDQFLSYEPTLTTTTSDDEGNTESVVAFMPDHTHNDRELICRASNSRLSNSSIEDRVWISVEFVPIINISLDSNQNLAHVVQGDYIRVKCLVYANPWITAIEWALNGKHIKYPVLIDKNQTLVIDNIQRQQSGRYQCTASNSIGRTASDVLVLDVKFPPVCRKGQQIYYNVVRNLVNTIKCSVDVKPVDSSLRFKWFVNTSMDVFELKGSDIEPMVGDMTTSLAKYRPKTALKYAMVLCLAENYVGLQREPCIFYLSIQNGPPDTIQGCEISHTSRTIISINCMAGNNGGLRPTYHLEVYHTVTEQLVVNYTAFQPKFVVDSLAPDGAYNLIVYASNEKGVSQALTYPAVRLPIIEDAQSSNKTTKDINPLMNSLIGIVVSIVIFIICIAIIVKIKRFIYEDEYTVVDQIGDDYRRKTSIETNDSNEGYTNEQQNLMVKHCNVNSPDHNTSETYSNISYTNNKKSKSRLSRLKRLTNLLKVTKTKTLDETVVGNYRNVLDTEPKKIVKFATFEEFFDELNTNTIDGTIDGQVDELPYEERAIDVPVDNAPVNETPVIKTSVNKAPVDMLPMDTNKNNQDNNDVTEFKCYCCPSAITTVDNQPMAMSSTADTQRADRREAKRQAVRTRRQFFRKTFFRKTL